MFKSIIIIIIALFYDLPTALQTVSNMYAQVAWAQLCANHEQQCATWYKGTAQLLNLSMPGNIVNKVIAPAREILMI